MSPSAFIPLYLHRLTCHQFAVHYLMVYVCVYVCAGVQVCVCVCTLWKTQTLCPCAHITCDGIHNPSPPINVVWARASVRQTEKGTQCNPSRVLQAQCRSWKPKVCRIIKSKGLFHRYLQQLVMANKQRSVLRYNTCASMQLMPITIIRARTHTHTHTHTHSHTHVCVITCMCTHVPRSYIMCMHAVCTFRVCMMCMHIIYIHTVHACMMYVRSHISCMHDVYAHYLHTYCACKHDVCTFTHFVYAWCVCTLSTYILCMMYVRSHILCMHDVHARYLHTYCVCMHVYMSVYKQMVEGHTLGDTERLM